MKNNSNMTGKKEIFAVLDIGTTKIVYIVAEKNGKEVKILGHATVESSGVNMGDIVNVVETSKDIEDVFKKVESNIDIKPKKVIVGIAGYNISTKIVSAYKMLEPNVPIDESVITNIEEEIKRSVSGIGNDELLYYFPKDYIIKDINDKDKQVLTPIGLFGKKLTGNYHVVLINKTVKKHIETCIKTNGKEIAGYILEPVASAESTLDENQKEVGVLMIDIGGGTSDLIAFKDNKIVYTTVNPVGSVEITESIKNAFNITLRDAEALKIKYGECVPSKVVKKNEYIKIGEHKPHLPDVKIGVVQLAQNIAPTISKKIIAPLMGDLNKQCIKVSDFRHVILTGGGAKLKNIDYLVSGLITLGAEIGVVKQEYEVNGNTVFISESLQESKYATAVGMLLYSVKKNYTVEYDSMAKNELENVDEIKEEKQKEPRSKKKEKKGSIFRSLKEIVGNLMDDIE
jgi:cell division protein FtsA